MPFDGKKTCWIPDQKEGYVKADIESTKGDDVTVQTAKGEVRVTGFSFSFSFFFLSFFLSNL